MDSGGSCSGGFFYLWGAKTHFCSNMGNVALQGSIPTSEVDPKGAEQGERIKKEGASPADLASG